MKTEYLIIYLILVKNIFSDSIFQYGLGAYDLYIETNNKEYLKKFFYIVEWTKNNQNENGAWNCFGCSSNKPYSSMAQSEETSILCRAYKETNNKGY